MIEAEKVFLKMGTKMILKDINLAVSPGEYVVLLGPNGAGKSTLLKVLSFLIKPSAGRVMINGKEGPGEDQAMRKKIGFLSHRSFLYDRLTAWENLKFYGGLFEVPDLSGRIEEIAEQVGLSYFLYDPVYTFSRGMVQRLAIARAVLHDPEILFLDEPYTGLDQKGAEILSSVLAGMHGRGKTVFMVTHNFDQGLHLAHRVLIMVRGVKIFDAEMIKPKAQDIKDIYTNQVDGVKEN